MAEFRLPTLNKVFLSGNLTRDPEIRYTASGAPVASFRVASNRWYRTPEGERREDVCYVNVVAWQRLAELVGSRLRKGSAVLVEGQLQSRQWEGENGVKRSAVEIRAFRIQFLTRGEEPRGAQPGVDTEEAEALESEEMGDDLPF